MTAMTANELITQGYRDAHKIARGVTLTSDQLNDGLDRLNDIINFWQTKGMKLHLQTEATLTLTAALQPHTLMTGGTLNVERPTRVIEATYWDSSSNSRPLVPLSRDEWTRLSNRTTTGTPTQYFAEKLYDRINLYLWPVVDSTAATGTIHLWLQSQATNVATGENTRFPKEWALALRWALADELAQGMPESVQQRCQARAIAYRHELEDWDVEDAETYFQPDARMQGGSRFR